MLLRRLFLLAVLAFSMTAFPLGSKQAPKAKPAAPALEQAQSPAPWPPECGLFDICKDKKRA